MTTLQNNVRLVLVIGAPGTGKGTVGQHIVAKEGARKFAHISTGDICREEVERKTDLGRRLEAYLPHDLVPDSIIVDVITDRLSRPEMSGKTVLLDGFPRTENQAQKLTSAFAVDRIVLLQAGDDACLQRIQQRRIDPVTSTVYNLQFAPPTDRAIASRLVTRPLDKEDAMIRGRQKRFHASLSTILNFFAGKIFAINSAQPITRVVDAVLDVLEMPLVVPELPAAQPKQAPAKVVVKDKKGDCVVCRTSPADYLITPCGHQCGCSDCLNQLMKSNSPCPICRNRIQNIVKVFQMGFLDPTDTEGCLSDAKSDANGNFVADELVAGWQTTPKTAPTSTTDVCVSVAPCEPVSGGQCRVAVTVHVPEVTAPRVPVDVCCVIDISGSMNTEATFQDPKDDSKTVGAGMSQLDLVKHSVKTIIQTLHPTDTLSITTFSDQGHVVLAPQLMDNPGKANATSVLESLVAAGCTNIWAGVQAGLDSLRTSKGAAGSLRGRNKFLVALTDGQPTNSPSTGEAKALEHYRESHADFKFMLSTFGFGYGLKSKMLTDMATMGGGTFAFIPDAKILGTCFVNAVANARTCFCLDSKIHLTAKNGCEIDPAAPLVDGTVPWRHVSWGTVVQLGPLHAGQSRDFVVTIKNIDRVKGSGEFLDATVEFVDPLIDDVCKIKGSGSVATAPTPAAAAANARASTCATMAKVIDLCDQGNLSTAQNSLKSLEGQLRSFDAKNIHHNDIKAVLDDVSGRVTKSVSTTERFNRWGSHYLRALYRSHQLQMKTNFMDPGLQVYGGSLTNKLIEDGGKVFVGIPMQKNYGQPQRPAQAARAQVQCAAPVRPPSPVAQDFYGGSGGGCFAGSCLVETLSSGVKPIANVRAGEQLRMADGSFLPVAVMVELNYPRCDLVKVESCGLLITPNHPIRDPQDNSCWIRPRELTSKQGTKSQFSPAVYNLLFQHRPTCGLLVNGVECVTYGHKIAECPHPFYGTNAVIEVVSQLQGFDSGYIRVAAPTVKPSEF